MKGFSQHTMVGQDLKCPKCQRNQNGATSTYVTNPPKANDISICLYCKSLNQYDMVDGKLSIVLMPEDRIIQIREQHPDLWRAIEANIELAKKVKA